MAPNPRPGRFSPKTPLERERRLQIQREQRRRRRQQETAEQKEHHLAQRRQHRQQETEEQEIGIRGIIIVLHCRNPDFLVSRFPRQYIDQSLQSFSFAAVLRPEE